MHRNGIVTLGLVLVAATLTSKAAPIWDEEFNYPDGPLAVSSGGVWYAYSGGANQMTVSNGSVIVSRSNSEDLARDLGSFYSSGTLYYSALITMTEIPGPVGSYLMHFSDTESNEKTDFFARLYVKAVGAGYQFGIRNRSLQAEQSDYPVVFDESVTLSLGQQVAIVVKFDFETLQSTLWINPLDESSASVTDTFEVSFAGDDQTLSRLSLREASGIGTSSITRIVVGTTFEDVYLQAVPEPASWMLFGAAVMALGVEFRRDRRKARASRYNVHSV